jgi:hypothetical protein
VDVFWIALEAIATFLAVLVALFWDPLRKTLRKPLLITRVE